MKPLFRLFTVGALLTASLAYAAGFEGKVTLAMTAAKGKTQELDYSMQGNAVRIDLAAEGHSFASIMDLQKMEMLILMPEQHMYMIMPIKEHVEKAVQGSFDKEVNVEKTGRTETILGYKCDEYVSKDKDATTEVWVAEGLGSFMGLGSGGGNPMAGMFGGGGKGKQPANGWEQKFKGKPGFPLRVISRNAGGKETFKMEATKIEPGSLPASLFQPPAGWQKFDMGGMMKGFGQ